MQFRKHNKTLNRRFRHLVSAPFIYFLLIPIVFLDAAAELYHRICFPLYGLPLVKRNEYIRIDRTRLSYLAWDEKINCAYCGYVNGLLLYAARIAQESERYWCGIMHEGKDGFKVPEYQKNFLPYGDEKAFEKYVNDPNCEGPDAPEPAAQQSQEEAH